MRSDLHSSVSVTERYAHIGQDAVLDALREAELVPKAPDTEPTLVPPECMPEAFDTMPDLGVFATEAAHA